MLAGAFIVGTNLSSTSSRSAPSSLKPNMRSNCGALPGPARGTHPRPAAQATTSAGLGLRRLTSENLEDFPQVTVSALLVSPKRHDAALEQIIDRMSLEPFVTAARWQAAQAPAESWGPVRSCRKYIPRCSSRPHGRFVAHSHQTVVVAMCDKRRLRVRLEPTDCRSANGSSRRGGDRLCPDAMDCFPTRS